MKFNEEKHTYTRKGYEYISGTQLRDAFVPPFKKDEIAGYVAKSQDRDKDDVLSEWELKGSIACNLGDFVHKTIEGWIKFGFVNEDNPISEQMIDNFPIDKEELETESIVYNDNCKVAGTIDLIRSLSKGNVRLLDIKSNKNLKKTRGKFLEPFDDIKKNKLNKYRMQLTIYKMLYESMFTDKSVQSMSLLKWEPLEEDGLLYINWKEIKIDPIEKMEELGLEELVKRSRLKPKKLGLKKQEVIDNLLN